MQNNITSQVVFEEQCVIDEAKVFYYENRILRAIYNKREADLYRKILSDGSLDEAFETGLVKTWIADDIVIDECSLVLEHEKIDFFIHPVEMTNSMYWTSCSMFVKILISIGKKGLLMKDAHPWNLSWHKGRPVYFDFSSIIEGKEYSKAWFNEFYTYFAVPVKMAASKWHNLSPEYRRQHIHGIGIKLATKKNIQRLFFKSFLKLENDQGKTGLFLQKLDSWIMKQKPEISKGYWDNYEQGHNTSFDNPETIKQKFVYNTLKEFKPRQVADLATNKGYYGFMAEHLGAKVIAFDYEEFSVDEAVRLVNGRNITFCHMNFTLPTASYGWALVGPDAFKRFRSDIGLALGLIHHVCLLQHFPVKLFCDTAAKYSRKGVVMEFVYPEDMHVQSWNISTPADYNIASLKKYFGKYFNNFRESELMTEGGIKRQMLFFYSA